MAGQQFLNKHNRTTISQTAFWLMVVVNFVIRRIPVEPFDSTLGIAGIALLILGALTRSWAAGYIRKAKGLATAGPYALSRNPHYLGAAFMLAGLVCLVPDVLTAAVLFGMFIVVYYTTIRSEEEFLRGALWAAVGRVRRRDVAVLPVPPRAHPRRVRVRRELPAVDAEPRLGRVCRHRSVAPAAVGVPAGLICAESAPTVTIFC